MNQKLSTPDVMVYGESGRLHVEYYANKRMIITSGAQLHVRIEISYPSLCITYVNKGMKIGGQVLNSL